MKKIDNIGEIFVLSDRVDWKITKFSEWPKINNDTIIRSPLFHYAGGDRYFCAQLKLEEGFVIFTGLSITCCSKDRHDFYGFIFGAFGDYGGAKVFLMTGPAVHGGSFFTSDFKDKQNQIMKSNGNIHLFCRTLVAFEDEMNDVIAVLPLKGKKSSFKEVSTQTDLESGINNRKDDNFASNNGATQKEIDNGFVSEDLTIIAA